MTGEDCWRNEIIPPQHKCVEQDKEDFFTFEYLEVD